MNRFLFRRCLAIAAVFPLLLPVRLSHGAPSEAKDSPPDAKMPATNPVPFLSAEDAIKTMNLPPGFHMEVVATEPFVQHPVTIAFDADGRMWVVEMRSYMPDTEGKGEEAPTGRISILEDTDGDGRMDKSTVFLDHLVLPRAIALTGDGVLVGEPPNLTFYRAGEKTVIAKDFQTGSHNPEAYPNGLMYGLDNWLYNVSYNKRLRYFNNQWVFDTVPILGEWGISQDDWGRLIHNSNSDYLRGSFIPIEYAQRNPNYRPHGADEQIDHDQNVWPAHNTAVNRGYVPNFLRPDGTLRAFTAACGPVIYRGGLFPKDFEGNAFVCEPSANVIRRSILVDADNGAIVGKNAYDKKEFIASTYERFRPVNLFNAPDGSLYVVDMHHGLIQHRTHLTTWAKNQYLQRQLEQHLMTGRIYRIVADGTKPYPMPHLSSATTAELIATLSHPSGWWRDTAQRLLVERADPKSGTGLRKLATSGANPLGRLHALWTLQGLHQLDSTTLLAAFTDVQPRIRAAAIRLSESLPNSPRRSEIVASILRLAPDPNPNVLLQFALTATGIGSSDADKAIANVLSENASNIYIRDAVLSGLRGRELEFLQILLQSPRWPGSTLDRDQSAVLRALSSCIVAEGKPKRVTRLLNLIANEPDSSSRQVALVDGFPGPPDHKRPRRPKSIMLDSDPKLTTLDPRMAEKLYLTIHWPGQPGYVPPPPPPPLTSEQQSRFDAGRVIYSQTCIQCHQVTGLGQEGKAPPLLDSEWALGPDSRAVRIVLKGLQGPINVSGQTYNLEMPSFQVFSDEQVASVLTYVRREWDHEAAPVEPVTVQKIREQIKTRSLPWTERELLQIN